MSNVQILATVICGFYFCYMLWLIIFVLPSFEWLNRKINRLFMTENRRQLRELMVSVIKDKSNNDYLLRSLILMSNPKTDGEHISVWIEYQKVIKCRK